MKYLTKRNVSIVSAVLATMLGLQLLLYLADSWFWQDQRANAAQDDDSQEKSIVADLSNMTGAAAEDIRKLRAAGLSWNEVVEALKRNGNEIDPSSRNDRIATLLSGMSSQTLEQLQAAGYSEDAIQEAKLIAERVLFQMTEIVQDTTHMPPSFSADLSDEHEAQEKRKAYKAVLESFNLDDAVRLMLAWESELGGYRQAMNEYLFILQAELDLEEWLQDLESYLKEKEQLRLHRWGEPWLTMEEIERELLESVQMRNTDTNDPVLSQPEASMADVTEWQSPLPEVSIPQARDVKPSNPTDAILEEIRAVDPREDF